MSEDQNQQDQSKLRDSLRGKLQPLARPWWKPETVEEDGPVTASKFAGTPWLKTADDWPVCPNCEGPMQMFVQLNTADLPAALAGHFGTGLIQVFYCTNDDPLCEDDCEAYFPFSKAVIARRVEIEGESAVATLPDGAFPARQITGWQQMDNELPGMSESETWCQEQGLPLSEAESEALWARENYEQFSSSLGDKVGGWPHWIQGPEYPGCPQCGTAMQMVIQIDSEDHLPYMFGDVGCAHLTQCPEHKDVLAFAWACG
ncbi:MAG: DUF1963 domain-containing protein [Candidatus Sericytochromatia bacterium]